MPNCTYILDPWSYWYFGPVELVSQRDLNVGVGDNIHSAQPPAHYSFDNWCIDFNTEITQIIKWNDFKSNTMQLHQNSANDKVKWI